MDYYEGFTDIIREGTLEFYDALIDGGIELALGILFLFAALTALLFILTWRKLALNGGQAFYASKTRHFIIIAGMIVWAIVLGANIQTGIPGIGIFVLLMALGVVTVYALVTVRPAAPVFAALFMWGGWAYTALPCFFTAYRNSTLVGRAQVPRLLPVYAVSDHLLSKALLLELIVALVTPFIVDHCLRYQRWVYANGGRAQTGPGGSGSSGGFKSLLIQCGAVLAVLFIVFVPVMFSDVAGYFTNGDAQATNAFVACYREYMDDRKASSDPEWMEDFGQAYDALEEVNLRVFNINPRRVRGSRIQFFLEYSEASWDQLLIMKDIYTSIGADDLKGASALAGAFDGTNALKEQALLRALDTRIRFDEGRLGIVSDLFRILVGSFQYYLAFTSLKLAGAVLIVISCVMALFEVLYVRKNVPEGLMAPIVFLEVSQEQYCFRLPGKKTVIIGCAACGAAVALFAVLFLLPSESTDVTDYPQAVYAAVMDDAVPLMQSLLSGQEITAYDVPGIIEQIDIQLEGIRQLRSYNDVDAEYADAHREILELLPQMEDTLLEIRSSLEKGMMPDDELLQAYMETETELMRRAQYITSLAALTDVSDLFG